jgi:hypothetical protein
MKNTQLKNLTNILAAAGAKGLSPSEISSALRISLASAPVYVFGLKQKCKAEIDTIKEGKRVVAYVLKNPDSVVDHSDGRRSRTVTKKMTVKKLATKTVAKTAVKAAVVKEKPQILDKDLDIGISEREFSDIRSSLGLGSFGGSSFNRYSE